MICNKNIPESKMPYINTLEEATSEYWTLTQAVRVGNREEMDRHLQHFRECMSERVHRIFDERVALAIKRGEMTIQFTGFWAKSKKGVEIPEEVSQAYEKQNNSLRKNNVVYFPY